MFKSDELRMINWKSVRKQLFEKATASDTICVKGKAICSFLTFSSCRRLVLLEEEIASRR